MWEKEKAAHVILWAAIFSIISVYNKKWEIFSFFFIFKEKNGIL